VFAAGWAADEVVMVLLVTEADVLDVDMEEVTGPHSCSKHLWL